jgi:hypothetical protein
MTMLCRFQETLPFFKGQGHTYIFKVYAMTIRDYRYKHSCPDYNFVLHEEF